MIDLTVGVIRCCFEIIVDSVVIFNRDYLSILQAIIIFLMVKDVNSPKRKQEAVVAPSALSATDSLVSEIRDELKNATYLNKLYLKF